MDSHSLHMVNISMINFTLLLLSSSLSSLITGKYANSPGLVEPGRLVLNYIPWAMDSIWLRIVRICV